MDPKMKAIVTFVSVAAAIIAAALPLLFKKIPPNGIYGVRTCKTVSDPELWFKANCFGAKCFIVSGLLTLAACWFLYLKLDALTFQAVNRIGFQSLIVPLIIAMALIQGYIKKL